MLVKLENVRLSFPALFEAKAYKPGDKPMHKGTFLIPKGSDLDKKIQKAILDTVKVKFSLNDEKAQRLIDSIKNNPNKFCYQDGDVKGYDGYDDHMALTAKAEKRPTVIDRDKTPLTAADGKPYAGCYVNAFIEFFGYTNSGKGVSAGLGGVQFAKDGESFGGGTRVSEDDFDDLGDGADADGLVGDDEDGLA